MKTTSRAAVCTAARTTVEHLENRCLLSAVLDHGAWIIKGDGIPGSPDDQIAIDVSPTDSSRLRATINGKSAFTAKSAVRRIVVYGGRGNDTITLNLPADLKAAVTISGGDGNDSITGSPLDDYITGNDGNDSIDGKSGDDSIVGSWGNDKLDGGAGDDLLVGGQGSDLLTGDAGNDQIYGQTGGDSLAGGLGDDLLDGGAGADQLHGGYGNDNLLGGIGNDTLAGGDGKDSLDGGAGHNTVNYVKYEDHIRKTAADTRTIEQRINNLKRLDDPDQLKQWLIDQAIQQWKPMFGQSIGYWWSRGVTIDDRVYALDSATNAITSAPVPSSSATAGENNDHSTTNTQVQGVDEADLVKTDGSYLYILANNELIIMDAWPADQTHIISRTPIEGTPAGIYLQGNTVAVLSSSWTTADRRWFGPATDAGLRCPFPWRGTSQTTLTILDASDRENPKTTLVTKLDGTSSESRVIDGRLYLILDNPLDLPEPERIEVPSQDPSNADAQTQWVYESEDAYRARLESMTLDKLLPGYTSTVTNADGSTTTTSGPIPNLPDFYVPADSTKYAWNMFSVSLFDLNNVTPAPIATTSVVGLSGQIYASADNLYVASTTWEAPMGAWQGELRTDIHKFALNADSVPLTSTGEVAGWVVNQFAMDESGDYFRIATTSSSSDGTSNNVFVLSDSDNGLSVTGSVTGVGFSERIYSARFVGDRAYLVTFRQVDPLFTLDLTDPNNPTVAGELKIPGYSAYLHPFDYTDRDHQVHNLLIGVGRNADLTGRIRGVQVSLFDVTDIASPTQIDKYVYPSTDSWDGSTWTAAEWDHHAFSYFPDQGVLALPIVSYGAVQSQGLDVFKFNLEYALDPDPAVRAMAPIVKLGRVEHAAAVSRSLRIETFLYSIGSDAVKVVTLEQPDQLVADIPMPNTQPQPVPVYD